MRSRQLRPFLKRVCKFTGVGALLTPVSFLIYMALIHWAGIPVIQASLLRSVCMLPIKFLTGRHVIWRDRKSGLLRQFGWFLLGQPVTFAVHQTILICAMHLGTGHVWAYWIAVSLTGVFNFFWGDKVSFARRPAKPVAVPAAAQLEAA